MKKVLGIVVLGLLLSGCAALELPVTSGMQKQDYCGAKNLGAISAICNKRYIYFKNGIEVLKQGNTYAVFKDVTDPTTSTFSSNHYGNGTFVAEVYGWDAAQNLIDNLTEKKVVKKEKPKKKETKPSPDDKKIVPAGSGSGFFVSNEGHVITNYHVIKGCDINKLTFKGSQTEVKVLAVDKVNDIAILRSNAKPDVIFPVSNEDVSLLEDVIVAGFPLGKQISSAIKTHKGVVTALAGAGDNYSFFQTDAAINQGNSGGPIINQKGNVVGIAVATWVEEGVQGVHFGIKSSTLKTFASANGLSFASPNFRDQSNKDLGKLITKGTVYVECHMTIAKIKKMIAKAENRKAFFKEHK